jgi:hypothetical protein
MFWWAFAGWFLAALLLTFVLVCAAAVGDRLEDQ